ncbi:MAG: plasmid stabilization protein [Alphaproteobacteria bacterium]|nr:plasmid stabilization protein [Alphaproteobacteria bacterium]
MASIIVRDLDEGLKRRLRIRAARNGRSIEEEVRDILQTELNRQPAAPENLATTIRARFAPLGGADLDLPPRSPMRKPPRFD